MGLKIGVPKIRLSRKLLFITLGITVLLGGTGGAALYMGGSDLLGEPMQNVAGGECTDIQTMVLKTPTDHLWLRKYIRMENASGPERVRTALRIAGLLAKKNAVDLIHVSVLDVHGPDMRAGMRGRAIGAEVLIALKPGNLPEMKTPAMASYYEGPVNDEGRFYGDKVVVDFDEVRGMMTAMRSVEEKSDCTEPELPEDENAKKNDHGKPKKSKSADHGEKPAKDGETAEAHGEQPAKEQSFLDSVLSMVGLGGSEEKPTEDHGDQVKAQGHDAQPAKEDMSHAVAEEPIEPATDDHAEKPVASEEHAAPAESDAEAAEHEPVKANDHDAKATSELSTTDDASEDHDKPLLNEKAAERQLKLPGDQGSHESSDEKHVEAEPASHDAKPVKEAAH
ncbi:MAG: hypothetical protein JWL86_313 [Rhizobium sp.]|nr:hypothetical protein [Rhizobium sp.]